MALADRYVPRMSGATVTAWIQAWRYRYCYVLSFSRASARWRCELRWLTANGVRILLIAPVFHTRYVYSFSLRIHLGKDSSRRTCVKRRDCCIEAVCGHVCRSHTLCHALISVNMDTGSQILAWWQITETVNVIIFVTAKTSNLHCFRADWKTAIEVCLRIPYANYNLYWPREWFYYSARYIFQTLLLAKNNNFFVLRKINVPDVDKVKNLLWIVIMIMV